MECKVVDIEKITKTHNGIDLTRMECKEKYYEQAKAISECIDLTRMECKVFSFGSIFIGLLV